MSNIRTLKYSFAGGVISPEMLGRIDDAKYQSGLATCRNFITKPQGPAENRSGFAFVREAKDSTKKVRLVPFTYSTTQTMVIELGEGYFRFHTDGATLMDGDAPYEVENPYLEDEIFDVHYVQSADVLTLVHPNHAPRELRRLGALDWSLSKVLFSPPLDAPENVSATAYLPPSAHIKSDTKTDMNYVVTALSSDGVSESVASTKAVATNNIYVTGAKNTIAWTAVAGATRYNVYKEQAGIYGYIGQTKLLSIVDDNISPDLSKTPPIYDPAFMTDGITAVDVSNGGSGYGTTWAGGEFTSVSIASKGSGYLSPSVDVDDLTGTGATFSITCNIVGQITSVSITNPGSGYTNPTLTVNDTGTGSGADLSFVVSEASNTPVLEVSDATGTGAKLEPVVIGGEIVAVVVVETGSGYTSPTVSIVEANGGSGATFGDITLSGSDYPAAVSYFEQRRCFAGTPARPQNIWMTKSGTEANMSYSLPIRDDDRIAFRVAAREANAIRHIIPLSQLLLLTSAAEWRVSSVNSDAITPTSISVKPQSFVGASNVQPVIVNNTLLYGAARGGHVRECAYNWQANGFATGDLSIRAAHLFDTFDIVDMAYSKAPQPIVWFVSTSGNLLGLTYVPEQQVGAWHQHDTDGIFESCAVVAEGAEDVLYCIVRRTINGVSRRYVERMASRQFSDQADAFFVDCGLTYSGAPADQISGLDHLEGKTVSILADGAVHPQRVVVDGAVSLDAEASKVHIGLPITADIQTLPLAAQIDNGMAQGRAKNVNKVWLRVFRSSGIFVGPSADKLTEYKQRTAEAWGAPPSLVTDEVQVLLSPEWSAGGQVFVRQTNPLPMTIVSITAEVAIGG